MKMNLLNIATLDCIKARPEQDFPSRLAYIVGITLISISTGLLAVMAFGAHLTVSEYLNKRLIFLSHKLRGLFKESEELGLFFHRGGGERLDFVKLMKYE